MYAIPGRLVAEDFVNTIFVCLHIGTESVWVNVAHITSIGHGGAASCDVHLLGGHRYYVCESVQDLFDRIERATADES